jgi:phospholipid/cholesterol/gamma-HCH transport system substrate-binding protein
MTRRLWANAAAFSVLFAVLSVWAVRNVLHLDIVERPKSIAAEFETSPGLRAGYEVTYFGVHAGSVGRVAIDDDHVRVVLKIDRHLELPARLDGAVRRKSAVGEPYVDLTPTGGADPGGPRLREGAVIPRERTTTPLAYSEVFDAVDDLVTAVPDDDLERFVHSLAAGFEGRAGDIRSAIVGADRLTTDLVADAPLLDALASDLTTLTHTIAEHTDSLGQGWDNLAQLSATLADNRAHVAHLLTEGPTLVTQVQALLDRAGPDVGCIFDAAGSLWSSIDSPVKVDQFKQLLELSGPAADIVHQVAYQGPDGLYLNGVFTFDVGVSPVDYYDPPRTLPAAPALATCRAAREGGSTGRAVTPSDGQVATPTPRSVVPTPARPTSSTGTPPSSTQEVGAGRNLVVLLTLAAAATLGGLLLRRRWRAKAVPRTDTEPDATR